MFVKMLTHIHMVVHTWWCWHIYKGDEVGVDVDQLGAGSGPDAGVLHPVSGSSEHAGVDLRSDAGTASDRTLTGCIWSG